MRKLIFLSLMLFLTCSSYALAQIDKPEDMIFSKVKDRVSLKNPDTLPTDIIPVFFTESEIELVKNARKGLVTRAPTPAELDELTGEEIAVPMGPRNIKLGGIVYSSSNDWTVWLNNQQLRPDAIPEEVLDLKVFKEYIEIEWFDAFTNKIYPIRLRPNQTFNLDSRLFLPGA